MADSNRYVFLIASIVMLTAGFLPKVSALLTTIPQCVLGGATITVFASITTTGMRLIISEELTPRNTAIVGLAVALGVGITQAPDALQYFPSWVMTIFGSSSVVITTIAAIFLNQLIPKEKPAIQGTSTLQPNDASELDRLINLKEPDPID